MLQKYWMDLQGTEWRYALARMVAARTQTEKICLVRTQDVFACGRFFCLCSLRYHTHAADNARSCQRLPLINGVAVRVHEYAAKRKMNAGFTTEKYFLALSVQQGGVRMYVQKKVKKGVDRNSTLWYSITAVARRQTNFKKEIKKLLTNA